MSRENIRNWLLAASGAIFLIALSQYSAPTWILVMTAVIFVGVALLLERLLKRRGLFAIIAVIWIVITVIGLVSRPKRFTAFSEVAYWWFLPRDSEGRYWRAVNEGTKNCEKYLIDLLLVVRLENVHSEPAFLDQIEVEAQAVDGNWLKLLRVDTDEHWKNYSEQVGKFPIALQLNPDLLTLQLKDSVLRPNEPIRGSILLQYPATKNIWTPHLRLLVADRLGAEKLDLPQIQSSIRDFEFKAGASVDLSSCHILGRQELLNVAFFKWK